MIKLKLLVPAILTGVLLSLAWLGFSGIILLIAFIPLFYVEDCLIENRHSVRSFNFLIYSFAAFIFWNALSAWWMCNASIVGALFAIVTNSTLMSVVFWLFHIVKRKRGDILGYTFLISAWLSFEFLHYQCDLSWPWLTLGNGFANDVQLIQWYEYTGVFGGSLWVLVVNIFSWSVLRRYIYAQQKPTTLQSILIVFTIIIPVVCSLISYNSYREEIDRVNIVVAQPNIDPYSDKFSGLSQTEQLSRLLSVCDLLGDSSIDFFIGPETALTGVWETDSRGDSLIQRIRTFQNKYPKAAFVVGSITFREYPSDKGIKQFSRYNADSSFIYGAFNSALFIDVDKPVEFYHKSNLVSGVEKMPFKKYFHFIDKFIIDLGGTTGTLGTQSEPSVFAKDQSVVGVPICYESVYGEYLTGFVKKGANLIFVITNDGWWKDTPGYKQHLSFSRLRAIELRRGIARSGNTGISCLINQRGDILQKTGWWQQTSISGSLNRNSKLTFYAQHGDYIARINVLLLALIIVILLIDFAKAVKKQG
jgi:apolipoprotein N-acyltransferase